MRHNEARRLAEQFHNDFTPTAKPVYTGNGREVITGLNAATNTSKVLADVASWHERRRGARHVAIAAALRTASGTQPRAANDNNRQQRRRAA